jgi:hypothetical protein
MYKTRLVGLFVAANSSYSPTRQMGNLSRGGVWVHTIRPYASMRSIAILNESKTGRLVLVLQECDTFQRIVNVTPGSI